MIVSDSGEEENFEPNRQFERVFTEGREYAITLSVTTRKGCEASFSRSVDVGVIPAPEVAWTGATAGFPIDFHFYDSRLRLNRFNRVSLQLERADGSVVQNWERNRNFLNDTTHVIDDPWGIQCNISGKLCGELRKRHYSPDRSVTA